MEPDWSVGERWLVWALVWCGQPAPEHHRASVESGGRQTCSLLQGPEALPNLSSLCILSSEIGAPTAHRAAARCPSQPTGFPAVADIADPSCNDGWRGGDLGNLVSSQTRCRRIRRRAVATDSVRRGRRRRRRRPGQPLAHPHTHPTSSKLRGRLHVRPPWPTSPPRATAQPCTTDRQPCRVRCPSQPRHFAAPLFLLPVCAHLVVHIAATFSPPVASFRRTRALFASIFPTRLSHPHHGPSVCANPIDLVARLCRHPPAAAGRASVCRPAGFPRRPPSPHHRHHRRGDRIAPIYTGGVDNGDGRYRSRGRPARGDDGRPRDLR